MVLTHSDSDHIGLTAVLRAAGARVLIHGDDEPTLRKPGPKSGDASPVKLLREVWRPGLWRFFGGMMRAGGTKPSKIEDAQTFSGGDMLDVPGSPRVILVPGHTPGSAALHVPSLGALFVGDAFATYAVTTGVRGPQVAPFTADPARAVFNTSTDQCFESLATLEGLQAEVVLPGHGEPWQDGAAAAAQNARQAGRS